MNLDSLPFNPFDFVFGAFLVAGVIRGRQQGMSEELLNLLKWLAVVFGCSYTYKPLGEQFARNSKVFSLLSGYLMAYVAVGLVILTLFAWLKRALGGKLLGSDIFGRCEYYLGMGSGLVRFSCMMMAALSLLNARHFKPSEIQRMDKAQKDAFDSNLFPTLYSVQSMVFDRSLAGPWIRDNLGFLMIQRTDEEHKDLHRQETDFPFTMQ